MNVLVAVEGAHGANLFEICQLLLLLSLCVGGYRWWIHTCRSLDCLMMALFMLLLLSLLWCCPDLFIWLGFIVIDVLA